MRVTADAAYDTVAVYETATARGADSHHPTGQDGEHIWPRPAVARAGSDDHGGAEARPSPLEEGVRVPSSEAGWSTRSSATRPSSAMVFAPGVQLGREVRSSSALRSSIG